MMPTTLSASQLEEDVTAVFARVTRYPAEILDPEASLEEDLGIDSVKLGEVFSILREQYHLPQDMGMTPDMLRNIRSISSALGRHIQVPVNANGHGSNGHNGNGHGSLEHGNTSSNISNGSHPKSAERVASPQPVAAPLAGAKDPTQNKYVLEVQAIFAEVTRYPLEILDPWAQLEEDLGIDSVKLGEVFSVLRERYKLSEKGTIDPMRVKTILGIAQMVSELVEPITVSLSTLSPVVHWESNGHKSDLPAAVPLRSDRPTKEFAGKIALVSGSGRGLGKDVAVYLAELGATVIVNSFHSRTQGEETVAQIKAAGGTAIHAWGSVANPDQLHGIFDRVESEFGGLDFFISNASNGMLARLDEITPEHWEKAFRTNVVGLHQSALCAVNLMKKHGGGKIVTLSSPASHGYVDYFGCMGAVKAAVESLTKSMAIEFAPHNIQVNCVSPGPIYGELLDKWPESKRLIAEWEEATVCGRLCEARDVSHFIAYLLGKDVKLFTGSVLVMDGGISVRWG
jgi:enoyl-[acyl-carrier protein] reductase III